MKKVFYIKWEKIILVFLIIYSLINWTIIFINLKEILLYLFALIPTLITIFWIIKYNDIKEVREYLLRTWW